jgi:hypothetical protein
MSCFVFVSFFVVVPFVQSCGDVECPIEKKNKAIHETTDTVPRCKRKGTHRTHCFKERKQHKTKSYHGTGLGKPGFLVTRYSIGKVGQGSIGCNTDGDRLVRGIRMGGRGVGARLVFAAKTEKGLSYAPKGTANT